MKHKNVLGHPPTAHAYRDPGSTGKQRRDKNRHSGACSIQCPSCSDIFRRECSQLEGPSLQHLGAHYCEIGLKYDMTIHLLLLIFTRYSLYIAAGDGAHRPLLVLLPAHPPRLVTHILLVLLPAHPPRPRTLKTYTLHLPLHCREEVRFPVRYDCCQDRGGHP